MRKLDEAASAGPDNIGQEDSGARMSPGNSIRVIFPYRQKFPGFTMKLDWLREESGGNWYRLGESEGWLCPSLFRYFSETPKTLYVKAEARA